MSAFEYLLIVISGCLVIYFTVLFVLKIKGRGVAWESFRKWLKNIIDSLFGVG